MYKFEKTSCEKLEVGYSKIAGMYETEKPQQHSMFIGQVLSCFGEPDYVTDNYENLCSWAIAAIDEEGEETILEIYYGPSGPSISGKSDEKSKMAAQELVEYIKKSKAVEFHYECTYEDFDVDIEMGIKDGIAYYCPKM